LRAHSPQALNSFQRLMARVTFTRVADPRSSSAAKRQTGTARRQCSAANSNPLLIGVFAGPIVQANMARIAYENRITVFFAAGPNAHSTPCNSRGTYP
jgi:hypothetical protein